jgi:hypothetical protein
MEKRIEQMILEGKTDEQIISILAEDIREKQKEYAKELISSLQADIEKMYFENIDKADSAVNDEFLESEKYSFAKIVLKCTLENYASQIGLSSQAQKEYKNIKHFI